MKASNTTIFITYNPDNALEQTLASRLHTIGAVNGFRMYMPDRFNSDSQLDFETTRRINLSNYFILFSFGKLSDMVRQEIDMAFAHLQDPSRIIVIYNRRNGKNIDGKLTNHFTAFNFDPITEDSSVLSQKIIGVINHRERINLQNQIEKEQQESQSNQALAALIGIGLGLFALATLSKSER